MAMGQAQQLRGTASDQGVGLDITIRTGSGTGRTLLSAFDHALQEAGVADFNLVTLSSVIPPGSRIRHVDSTLPGGHGDLLLCVRAEAFAEHPGEIAWAGLGWCVDETGGGLFVEHHGGSEQSVMEQIELSLADMNANRGGGYGPVHMALASAHCTDLPVCALVLAAYRVSTWHEPGDEAARQQAAAGSHQTSAGSGRRQTHGHVVAGASSSPVPAYAGNSAAEQVHGARTAAVRSAAAGSDVAATEGPPVVRSPLADSPRVTVEKEVDYATAQQYYKLYRQTFGALETTAVARQLLHESEFLEEMLDPRVHKYVAWDDDDQAIGMTTVTGDLETVPWISPGYFAHHYPDHHARDAIYYLGFTLVHPDHRGVRVFHAMIEPIARMILANRGVVAWDMCHANDERGLGGSAGKLLRSLAEVDIVEIDRQTYYACTFHGPRETATGG